MGAMVLIPAIVLIAGYIISKLNISQKVLLRTALIVSFLYVFYLFFKTIFFIPAVQSEFSGKATLDEIASIIYCVSLAAAFSWPWLIGYYHASNSRNNIHILFFSITSSLSASFFLLPQYTGPVEGVGYTVIIVLIILWCLYPISMLFRPKEV